LFNESVRAIGQSCSTPPELDQDSGRAAAGWLLTEEDALRLAGVYWMDAERHCHYEAAVKSVSVTFFPQPTVAWI